MNISKTQNLAFRTAKKSGLDCVRLYIKDIDIDVTNSMGDSPYFEARFDNYGPLDLWFDVYLENGKIDGLAIDKKQSKYAALTRQKVKGMVKSLAGEIEAADEESFICCLSDILDPLSY